MLCSLDRTYNEEVRRNTYTLKENIKKTKARLERLSYDDQQEWSEALSLQARALYDAHK
jgi:hypothetical protein